MASLPFFHSFGCTVTLWYPMIEGVRAITYPTPVDVVKNAEIIERHRITLLVTTPTFLRGYLRRAQPNQFASIKLLVTGAEKLPLELAKLFEERFGKHVLEGYGLTETSPVVSTNRTYFVPPHWSGNSLIAGISETARPEPTRLVIWAHEWSTDLLFSESQSLHVRPVERRR